LTARITATATTVARQALATKLRTARYTARHAAKKPSARWAAGIAATAAVGAIAVTAAAPWASAATPAPATRDLAVKATAPVGLIGQPATHTATTHAAAAGTVHAAASTAHAAAAGTAHAAASTATHAAAATKHAAAKTTAATHAAATHAAAKHAAAKHAAKHAAASSKPSTIYDSVTPSSIPAGKDAAVYADGSYQASAASVSGHKHVLWIDTNGSRTDADVLDVEPGDATPAGAATWVKAKLTKDPAATAIVYTFKANWAPTTTAISALPKAMQHHVKYWIADPTGTPHILPGAEATQWYWGPNYDISTANPGFNS